MTPREEIEDLLAAQATAAEKAVVAVLLDIRDLLAAGKEAE